MTSAYLTSVGYAGPAGPEIRELFEADLKAAYGDDLAVGPAWEGSSIASIFTGLVADAIAAHAHEPAADLVANLTPESSSDYMLDNIKSITNTYRTQADYSYVTLTLGTDGVTDRPIVAGSIARKPADGTLWVTMQDCTIPGSGAVDVPARSDTKGPWPAVAGSITGIVTNIAGWDTVTNSADAQLGRNKEENADFRPRVEKGGSSNQRIHDAVDDVTGTTFVSVTSNPISSAGDVDGIPPGCIHVVVEGGDDEAIAQAIYETKSSLAGTVGDEFVDITDSEGNTERVYYDRITQVIVYIIVKVDVPDELIYPDDGDDQIIDSLVAYGTTLVSGEKLYNWKLRNALPNLAGVDDVTEILMGESDPPTLEDNLAALNTERFLIDAANITVVHV